jgi:hypothetical protein
MFGQKEPIDQFHENENWLSVLAGLTLSGFISWNS